ARRRLRGRPAHHRVRRRDDLRAGARLAPAADPGGAPAAAARARDRRVPRSQRRPAPQPREDGDGRVRALTRLLPTAAVAAAILVVAGFSGVAHASVCSAHAVSGMTWARTPGARSGVLRWKAPALVPAEVGYRVWRS